MTARAASLPGVSGTWQTLPQNLVGVFIIPEKSEAERNTLLSVELPHITATVSHTECLAGFRRALLPSGGSPSAVTMHLMTA